MKVTFIILINTILLSFYTLKAQDEVMSPELLWDLGRVSAEAVSPNGNNIYYGVTRYNIKDNSSSRNLYMISAKGGQAVQITEMEGSVSGVAVNPNGKKLGFMHDGQLWEANLDGSQPKQVTEIDGGISTFKYSPNGKKIAFSKEVKIDNDVHDQYPNLPLAEARIINDLLYRHWDKWEDGYYTHIFIADYTSGEVTNAIDIMNGQPFNSPLAPFGGSEDYSWHPNGTMLAYSSKKLSGYESAKSTNTDIYLYNISTKKTTNWTLGNLGYDTQPTFSKDGETLAWLSMKTEGYESDQQILITQLLDKSSEKHIYGDQWDNTITGYSWSDDQTKFIIGAGINATYQIFEVYIDDTDEKFKQITHGIHNIGKVIGTTHKGNYIATRTDMNHAAEIYSFDSKKGAGTKLTTVNDSIYTSIKLSRVEKQWIRTTDGKEMLTWVIYPPDFDSTLTYPTLLYCQGGPQSAVSQFYSFRWNFQLMAANGYIVIAPNRRGLPTFGLDWNASISKNWGGQAIDDYMSAVNQLKKRPYIDPKRIGAVGASYGGYSVYLLAGVHQNTFCSFVSHCGLYNLESWYGVTDELFFANYDIGGPYWGEDVPKSYLQYSPHKKVGNWNTPILIIHGGNDFRVPINQGQEAFQVAKIKGLKTRFLYFPNEGHWVLKPQNGLLWHSEFFKWLDETVK